MDVRRRLVGLALCSVLLIAGVPWGGATSTAVGALTIDGQYESAGPLGAGEVRNLVVTGRGGVPANGVGAVALNVTVTEPTESSFITAWPTGQPRPTAANLNFVPGQTRPNMVVVKVGDFGQVSFYNLKGNAHLVVDVMGWFPEGATYTGLTPARLLDTRPGYPTIDGQDSGTGRVGADAVRELSVVGRGGVPLAGVGAVALNVTAVEPNAGSFLTAYPTGAPRPTSANLNYVAGDIVPNMVIVKVGDQGRVSLYNYAGTVDLVVDIMGWFPATGSFTGLTPARLMDTRPGYPTIDGQFAGAGKVGENASTDLVVTGRGGVPATGVGAVVLNVAVTNPTEPSFLTIWPAGTQRPLAANLNFVPGQTVPNMVIAKVGVDGKISIYNYGGEVDVVVDVMGWFPVGVAYEGLVPARLMDTRPGGTPTVPSLPTTSVGSGGPTTTPGGGGPTTTGFPTTVPQPEPPPAPWTDRQVGLPIVPRIDTPRIIDGEVFDIETIGDAVYVLGSFTQVQESDDAGPGGTDGQPFAQPRLIKYSMSTGLLDRGFTPTFDGVLFAVEATPDGTGLFVAGTFNTVDGVARGRVVKLDPDDGSVITAFNGRSNFRATALAATNTTVFVGGEFNQAIGPNGTFPRTGLAAFDAVTGAVRTGFDLSISGGLGLNDGGVPALNGITVQQLKVTPDGSRLIVFHTGRQIAGQDRYGVGIVNIPANPAGTYTLNGWNTRLWQDNLMYVGGIQRLYTGEVSPDGSYFVAASGSGGDRPPINDTAMAFAVNDGPGDEQPLWVSRHFDSVYAVAINDDAVFVGGHFSWQESPRAPDPWPGFDNVGYGNGQGNGGYSLGDDVVRREQLGALDPATGKALEWNPFANGNEGVKALRWVEGQGLFVGVDVPTTGGVIGGQNIGLTGFFDVDDHIDPDDGRFTTIRDPYDGVVVPTAALLHVEGEAWSVNAGETVRRVNVQIQRRGQNSFLCPDGSFAAGCVLQANLSAAPNTANLLTWSIDAQLPDIVDEYDVFARVVVDLDPNDAVGGNAGPTAQDNVRQKSYLETFSFDDAAPQTAITGPTGTLINTTTVTVTGRSTDDLGVQSVSFSWRETNRDLYLQDDGTLAPTFNSIGGEVLEPGAPTSDWEATFQVPEGVWEFEAQTVDSGGQSELRGASRDWVIDVDALAPTVQINTPASWTAPPVTTPPTPGSTTAYGPIAPGSPVTFSGVANDEGAVAAIEVYLRNTTTFEGMTADGLWQANASANYVRIATPNAPSGSWSFNPASLAGFNLTPGVWDFRVRAIDNQGLPSVVGRISMTVQVGQFPNGTLSATGTFQDRNNAADLNDFTITGTATDDAGVAEVRVAVRDADTSRFLNAAGQMVNGFTTINAALASPGATSTGFTFTVDLPSQGDWNFTAYAVDSHGQIDPTTTGATAQYLIYPGDEDPVLVAALNVPADGATLPAGGLTISGRAEDGTTDPLPANGGISAVRITIFHPLSGRYFTTATTGPGFVSVAPVNLPAFLTSPAPNGGNPGTNFNWSPPTNLAPAFTPGQYIVGITPVDMWGQVGATRTITVTLQ